MASKLSIFFKKNYRLIMHFHISKIQKILTALRFSYQNKVITYQTITFNLVATITGFQLSKITGFPLSKITFYIGPIPEILLLITFFQNCKYYKSCPGWIFNYCYWQGVLEPHTERGAWSRYSLIYNKLPWYLI